MSSTPELKTIALVGATGNLGRSILSNLLPRFPRVTVIARPESNLDSLPKDDKITAKRVATGDHQGYVQALTGVDALVITQAIGTPMQTQLGIIEAAVEAGVKWILPNEYGSDTAHAPLNELIPIMAEKQQAPKLIEARASEQNKPTKWISVVTNPWFDYNFATGAFGIIPSTKTATFYDSGTNRAYVSSIPFVGEGIARILSLPTSTLSSFANRYVYLGGMHVSQRDVLTSVQRVTGTTDADWTINHADSGKAVEEGLQELAKGRFDPRPLFVSLFREGMSGAFQGKEIANAKLGLKGLDVDEEVRKALKA